MPNSGWRVALYINEFGSVVHAPGPGVEIVEVMPVSEHERWRDAFLEGQKADRAKWREHHLRQETEIRQLEGQVEMLREAAQALVDENVPICETDLKPSWRRLVAALDSAGNRGTERS